MSPHSTLGALGNLDLAVEWFGWCFVQVTLFAAAVAVVYRLTCQQRAGRNVALLAAALATVGLLTLASASPWPRWNFNLFTAGDQSSDDRLPAVGDGASGLIDQQVRRSDAATDIDGDGQWNRSNRDAVEPAAAINGEAANANLPALNEDGPSWSYYVVAAAWLAASFGLLRLLVGLVYLRLHRRSSRPIKDAELRAWFGELCERLHVAAPVELRESASLEVAATIGWRRPLVLLPSSWREWTADQRRAVLAHELSHVAERHVPQWLVSQVATVPHFYHPLVHWLGRRLRLEQELAADQLAARTFGSRRRYADALAALALRRPHPAGPLSALGLFMSRPFLMRRIAMLRQPTAPSRRLSRSTHILALSLVVLAAVGVAGLRASAPAAEELPDTARSAMETSTPPAYENLLVEAESVESGAESAKPTPGPIRASRSDTRESTRELRALLRVSYNSGRLFNRADGEQSWRIYSRTQAALLGSKMVLHSALRKPEVEKLPLVTLQQEPLDWLHNRLVVGFIPDSEIMYVRMEAAPDEVEQVRTIIDTVVKTYLDQLFVYREESRRAAMRDALAKSLSNVNREITEKMEDYFALAKELGAADAFRQQDPERSLVLNEISEMLRAKSETERHLAELRTNFLVIRQTKKDSRVIGRTTKEAIEEHLANDPNMVMLHQQLMQLQMQLAEENTNTKLPTRVGDRLRAQIEAVERQIEQLREQMKLVDGSRRGESSEKTEAVTREFELRASLLRERIRALEKAITEKTELLMKKSEQSVDLRIKAAALEHLQEIARNMSIRLEEIDVEASVPHDRVRVVQWAM